MLLLLHSTETVSGGWLITSALLNPVADPQCSEHLKSLVIFPVIDFCFKQLPEQLSHGFSPTSLFTPTRVSVSFSSIVISLPRGTSRICLGVIFLLNYTHSLGELVPGWENVFRKGPDRKYLKLWGHVVWIATTHHLWHCIRKAATDNVETNGGGCVSIKLYFVKKKKWRLDLAHRLQLSDLCLLPSICTKDLQIYISTQALPLNSYVSSPSTWKSLYKKVSQC